MKLSLTLAVLAAPMLASAQTITLAYWDLNTLVDNTPSFSTLVPNIGTTENLAAALFRLNENTSGTDTYRWHAEPGSSVNLLSPSVAGNALRVQGSSNSNGKSFEVQFSTVGYEGVQFSFAQRMTHSGEGHDLNQLSWSTDGTNFTNFGLPTPGSFVSAFTTQNFNLATVTDLDNQPVVYLRITLGGATGTQFTRGSEWDNFLVQANVAPIPEPAFYASAVGLVVVGAALLRRRRLRI